MDFPYKEYREYSRKFELANTRGHRLFALRGMKRISINFLEKRLERENDRYNELVKDPTTHGQKRFNILNQIKFIKRSIHLAKVKENSLNQKIKQEFGMV